MSFSNEEKTTPKRVESPHNFTTQNAAKSSHYRTVVVYIPTTRRMTRRTAAAADGDDDDESTTKPRKPAVVRSSKRARRAPKAVYDNDFEAHEIQNVRRLFFVSSSSLFLSLETFTTTRGCLWRFVITTTKRLTTTTSLSSSRRLFLRACK